MLDAVKRYATRVLVIHLALLILVISVVLGAARQVQVSARTEAQNQSRERLQLLADQTASGLESHYRSILSVLDVVLHDDAQAGGAATGQATMPADVPLPPPVLPPGQQPGGRFGFGGGARGGGPFGNGRGGGGRMLMNRLNLNGPVNVTQQTLNLLGRQLTLERGPVAEIFLVDVARGVIYNPQDRPGGGGGGLGAGRGAFVYPVDGAKTAEELLKDDKTLQWIKAATGAQMSEFRTGGAGLPGMSGGYHLIALPAQVGGIGEGFQGGGFGQPGGGFGGGPPGGFPGGRGGGFGVPQNPNGLAGAGGPGGGSGQVGGTQPATQTELPQFVMVVVVPMNNAAEEFLTPLNAPADASGGVTELGPLLVNDAGQVLVDNPPIKAGDSLMQAIPDADSDVRKQLDTLIAPHVSDTAEAKASDSLIIDHAFTVDGKRVPGQIVASAQFGVPSGKRWTVVLSSPLSEADVVVNRVFRSAAWWALFVSLSVTAILVSTSAFLITARVRLERTRHEVLTRELEQARHIQLAWLPDMKTVPAGIEISAVNLPASHISGDFYNWFLLPARADARGGAAAGGGGAAEEADHTRIAIVIGDVTGHGMAAAFLMATTQLLVRMTLSRYQEVGRCLREVNRQLCAQATGGAGGFQGQFVTMLLMVLDTQNNTVQIASAGHPTPLIETGATLGDGLGRFKSVEIEPQLVLGVNPEEDYHAQTISLEAGASVVLYTDGVVEAERADGRQYGVANLIELLERQNRSEKGAGGSVGGPEPAQRTRAILEDVKKFCAGQELHDDLTLVALRTSAVVAEVGAVGGRGH